MQIALRHPSTGKFRFVRTGWSWSIFLGAGFFGLPLFFRGLALWGTLMLALWFLQLAVSVTDADGGTLERILDLGVLGLSLYLGFRGNALSARHFLACGYEFVDPDSAESHFGRNASV
jgi:hypothetical protein